MTDARFRDDYDDRLERWAAGGGERWEVVGLEGVTLAFAPTVGTDLRIAGGGDMDGLYLVTDVKDGKVHVRKVAESHRAIYDADDAAGLEYDLGGEG